jgi:hypothetical protein
MKTVVIFVFFTFFSVSFSLAQAGKDCNLQLLYSNLQGVWISQDESGDAMAIIDSNAYVLSRTNQGVWQDSFVSEFSIVCNNKGDTFFIWWSDLIVQEFMLEGDSLLLLDRRQRAEEYIRVK